MRRSLSIRAPLRHRAFRTLLGGGTLYFIASFMQSTAAAWMMVELTGSSFLAALVQTAVFLPMFLLVLPAGVLSDTTDRRRLMLGALGAQAVATALLTVLGLAGWAGPGSVLFLIFVAGCCTAVMSPAWNSTIGDSVTREDLPQAITLLGITYNAARALGPSPARCSRSGARGRTSRRPSSACWCWPGRSSATRRRRTRRLGCPPNGCGAASTAACATRGIRPPSSRSWCVRWPTLARARRSGPCCP
jgi:hypothetical protein